MKTFALYLKRKWTQIPKKRYTDWIEMAGMVTILILYAYIEAESYYNNRIDSSPRQFQSYLQDSISLINSTRISSE